jgi:dihydroorotase
MNSIELITPDDWHLHLRDGAAMNAVVAATARQFRRAIVMPNLKPPVTNLALASAYRDRILEAIGKAHQKGELTADQAQFEPLMTLYLTDRTSAADIREAKASGFVHGVKLYPAGATTNSDAGVKSLDQLSPALEAMQATGMPLLIHGEVTDQSTDVFDREALFIDSVLEPLRRRFTELPIVFEHITTQQAAQYVEQGTGKIAATITAHHLLYNRNALFKGGIRPHWYCLPILKREAHRTALLAAATSGNPKFFLGTDSAPHAQHTKENDCGCAGCYTAPHAMELYAAAFDSINAIDRLEGFASRFGPAFYGLPLNQSKMVLQRREWIVPKQFVFVGQETIVPLAAGELMAWKVA